jgi:hypothetical protein
LLQVGADGAPVLAVTASSTCTLKPIWSSTIASDPLRLPPRQQ